MRHIIPLFLIVMLSVTPLLSETSTDHVFNVKQFGALGDGKAKDTAAIQKAIDAAEKAGGGRVLLPPGTYLSGTIYLKSNVDFHLMAGTVLLGSSDPADYNAPDFCEQNRVFTSDFMSGAHLVACVEQTNVSLTGSGRIDGNAPAFLKAPDSDRFLRKQEVKWRPAQMIFFCECSNVKIRDVELYHSPYWTCFLHGCEDISIDGVRIWNRLDTANGDGIDIDCCQRGTVSNCLIHSGDDCITLRAHADPLKNKRPCENIVITNCVLKTSCQAVRVGVGAGLIRNCTFSNLAVHGSRTGLNFHSSYNPNSPGTTIENIRFDNITMEAEIPFTMTLGHAANETKIRNVYFRGISGTCRRTSPVGGKPENKLVNISFEDIDLALPPGVEPFKVLNFSHIDRLRLANVNIFERDNPGRPLHGAIDMTGVENEINR